MITAVKLDNIPSHIVTIVCVMRAPEIYSLSKCPVFSTVLLFYLFFIEI